MPSSPEPNLPVEEERPSISALFSQLADDTRTFARAEIDYLRAEVGERADIAIPGLAMIGAGMTLAVATLIALLIGLMLWLTPLISALGAALLVCIVALMLAAILWRMGLSRVRRAIASRKVQQ